MDYSLFVQVPQSRCLNVSVVREYTNLVGTCNVWPNPHQAFHLFSSRSPSSLRHCKTGRLEEGRGVVYLKHKVNGRFHFLKNVRKQNEEEYLRFSQEDDIWMGNRLHESYFL